MYCERCGAPLDDGVNFCPNCGAPSGDGPGANPYAVVPHNKDVGSDYLVLNILATIFCCRIFGIIGIVCAILSRSASRRGDWADAASKAETARLMFWIAFGTGLVMIIAYVGFALFVEAGEAGYY